MAENRQYLSRVTLRGITNKYLCRNNLTIQIKKHRFHIICSSIFLLDSYTYNFIHFPCKQASQTNGLRKSISYIKK